MSQRQSAAIHLQIAPDISASTLIRFVVDAFGDCRGREDTKQTQIKYSHNLFPSHIMNGSNDDESDYSDTDSIDSCEEYINFKSKRIFKTCRIIHQKK